MALVHMREKAVTSTFAHIAVVDNDPRALRSVAESIADSTSKRSDVIRFTDGVQALQYAGPVDLWIVDMSLEGMQGPSLCMRLRERSGSIPVLAMTSFTIALYEREAREAGVQGIVDKSDDTKLIDAIRRIGSEGHLDGFERPDMAHARLRHSPTGTITLTPREEQVLSLAAEGLLNPSIAAKLGVGESTVRKHLQHVLDKYGVQTSRQAVACWVAERRRMGPRDASA